MKAAFFLVVIFCSISSCALHASLITNKSDETITVVTKEQPQGRTVAPQEELTLAYNITNPRVLIGKQEIGVNGSFENPRIIFIGKGKVHNVRYEDKTTGSISGPQLIIEDSTGVLLQQNSTIKTIK